MLRYIYIPGTLLVPRQFALRIRRLFWFEPRTVPQDHVLQDTAHPLGRLPSFITPRNTVAITK